MKAIKLVECIVRKHLALNESKSGLYVYPSNPKDFDRIGKIIDRSDFYAEPDGDAYFFDEADSTLDALEAELDKLFNKYGVSVRYEAA